MRRTKQRRFLGFYGGERRRKNWAVRTKSAAGAAVRGDQALLIDAAGRTTIDTRWFEFERVGLTFGYCACDGDLGQYQGAEYDVAFLDEGGSCRRRGSSTINA